MDWLIECQIGWKYLATKYTKDRISENENASVVEI
jgi:hypothetical protein